MTEENFYISEYGVKTYRNSDEQDERQVKILPFCGICGVSRKSYEKYVIEQGMDCTDCLWVIEIENCVWEVDKLNKAS